MPIERIRSDDEEEVIEKEEEILYSEAEWVQEEPNPVVPGKKFLGFIIPTQGVYRGRRVAVFKRGTSGLFGNFEDTKEEVYIFSYELKKPERRVKG